METLGRVIHVPGESCKLPSDWTVMWCHYNSTNTGLDQGFWIDFRFFFTNQIEVLHTSCTKVGPETPTSLNVFTWD